MKPARIWPDCWALQLFEAFDHRVVIRLMKEHQGKPRAVRQHFRAAD